jgi:hypothetical protein
MLVSDLESGHYQGNEVCYQEENMYLIGEQVPSFAASWWPKVQGLQRGGEKRKREEG